MEEARRVLDGAVAEQRHADSALELAAAAARSAADRLAERTRDLAGAQREWGEQVRHWASRIHPHLRAVGVDAPAVDALVSATEGSAVAAGHEDVRADLVVAADELIAERVSTAAALEHRLVVERAAATEAQALVDELAARSEPDPPRFAWQAGADHCLADLIDFAPNLDGAGRAGIEAALEASGLLAARLVDGTGAELASGELVAIAAGGVPSPLSELLTVTVPDRLIGRVDAGLVGKLLDSISHDTAGGAVTAAGIDGSFRVGALGGRHLKDRAEFIGVTARREALERDRRAAAEALEQALAVVGRSETDLAALRDSVGEARRFRSELPAVTTIVAAAAAVDAANAAAEEAEGTRQLAAERAERAERAATAASDELRRRAVTMHLPADAEGLASIRTDLGELEATLQRCRSRAGATSRSAENWSNAVARWRSATGEHRSEQAELARIGEEHDRRHERLVTIRRSIGEEYRKVLEARGPPPGRTGRHRDPPAECSPGPGPRR